MTLPKFIITLEGVFRLAMVNQHKRQLFRMRSTTRHDDFNVSEELKIEYYD